MLDVLIVWFMMEVDGKVCGVVFMLWFWFGDLCFDLGCVDFYGCWIDWLLLDIGLLIVG